MQKSVHFSTKFEVIKPINDDFTLCKCRVMALGKNRNYSHFSKEAVDEALPTLANIPVVAHVYANDNGKLKLGGHDCEIVSEDGTFKFKPTTIPWGVVPESHNAHYEEVTEKDGSVVTYLTADLILWNRFNDIFQTFYSEDVYANQSMEIEATDWENLKDDSRYEDIKHFTFSALCLLNKGDDENDPNNVTPCFPSADIQPYKFEFDDKFNELTQQLKHKLAICFASINQEGGASMTKETIETILSEYSLTMEMLDFEIDENMSEEDLRTKIEAFVEANKSPATENFSCTYNDKRNAIQNVLEDVIEKNDNGELVKATYFWLVDFDDDYIFVERYIYADDNQEREYGRIKYSFDKDNMVASLEGNFEKMIVKWLTISENEEIEAKRNEYEELKVFKADCLNKEHKAECDAVIAQFTDLEGNEEFSALKVGMYEMDKEALEKECYVIRGKNITSKPAKQKNNFAIKIPIRQNGNDAVPTAEEEFYATYSK